MNELSASTRVTSRMSESPLFLGLDSSTQGLKAAAVDESCRVVAEFGVNFDADLPEYRTRGGVQRGPDGLTVTSPPVMWAAALDVLFDRMQASGFVFDRVAAVSGAGQQHGSVYWRRDARALLQGMSAEKRLRETLRDAFAVAASPVWMDSSTTAQCRAREAALGGPQAVADVTGSRAFERFTGNQIAKLAGQNPSAYAATERIALVSSFMASLLIGDYAPIDVSDGSGMNLLDIRARRWDPRALDVTAPGLAGRLGEPVASHTVVGNLHTRYAVRYGFPKNCVVVAFSGDNPCSLAGMRLKQPGDLAVSMGTSDTLFGALSEPHPSAKEGHIFVNPVEPAGFMAMICFKNGSLTREAVRQSVGAQDWKAFGALVGRTPPGNGGRLGFYMREPEITPPLFKTGIWRFAADARPQSAFTPEIEARALLEGQFLSMRLHGGRVGLMPSGILATGGASADPAVLRVLSDVLGAPVFTGNQVNSAALGAAYRALHGWRSRKARRCLPFADVVASAPSFTRVVEPDPAAHALYTALLPHYAALEAKLAAG